MSACASAWGCCSRSRCGTRAGWKRREAAGEACDMRILYVISGLGFGGAERQTILAARELVRRGHAVLIYALTEEVPRADELAGSAVELVVDAMRSRLDWAVVRRLRNTVRRWQPDVLQGMLYDGNVYSRLAAAG